MLSEKTAEFIKNYYKYFKIKKWIILPLTPMSPFAVLPFSALAAFLPEGGFL